MTLRFGWRIRHIDGISNRIAWRVWTEGQQSGGVSECGRCAPQKVYKWKLITTWPKNLPGLGTAPERLAQNVCTSDEQWPPGY